MKLFLKLLIFVFLFASCDSSDDEENKIIDDMEVQYNVLVELNWSKMNFPDKYPENAHFSRLVGLIHKHGEGIFRYNELASPGIKEMAETGAITTLDSEIDKMIINKSALNKILASNLSTGQGEIKFTISINKEYSYICLVSMIAPSPDWFIAVHHINLVVDDDFVDSKEVNLKVYDAGTDSGSEFTSENIITFPKEKIFLLDNGIFGDGENAKDYIGKVTFTKI